MEQYVVNEEFGFEHYDNMSGVTLDKIDKNGTHYYTSHKCPKCGGEGYISYYNHVDGGVCFLCGGSGAYETHFRVLTKEYEKKLNDSRIAKARKGATERNAKFLAQNGFSETGDTWLVLGNTFDVKEQLKASGAKFSSLLGWHFNHDTDEYPVYKISITDEIPYYSYNSMEMDTTAPLLIEDCYGTLNFGYEACVIAYVKSIRDAYEAAHKPVTEHFGLIGEKVNITATLKRTAAFDSMYGVTYIYTMIDAAGHYFTWKTSKYLDFEVGSQLCISGTVKDHKEYKGIKETELTRCKVA